MVVSDIKRGEVSDISDYMKVGARESFVEDGGANNVWTQYKTYSGLKE